MSCGPYLVHNAIDGVFLPRSPFPQRFLGSDLVLQRRTCFSHTHWRLIRIRAGTGGWRRRGSIYIDSSASFSSLLLPPNSGYCLLKAAATMHTIPMVRQLACGHKSGLVLTSFWTSYWAVENVQNRGALLLCLYICLYWRKFGLVDDK